MATGRRAKKVRVAGEFDLLRLAAELRPPPLQIGAFSWDIATILAARDEQMIGRFARPARLAESMRTDYALSAAYMNRLAPQRGLPVELEGNDSARGKRVLAEAQDQFGANGVAIRPETLADINGCLANHGIAFGVNTCTPRAGGTRIDFEHKAWPIEFVYWNQYEQCFFTRTGSLPTQREREECPAYQFDEAIVHGDGRWTIYTNHQIEPYKNGAILSGALIWAMHAFGVRDWAKGSAAHGNAKVIGELPEGVDIQSEHGQAFYELLRVTASADTPFGIKPHGSTVDYITNNSTAWQIFKDLVENGDKAAARLYLGQDGTMGTNPSAPGIDARGLFGVRNDIVEGDLRCIERGILTGVIEPWAAMNFGDSKLAPKRCYRMPDADEDARIDALGKRTIAFFDVIQRAKQEGFDVTPEYVAATAESFGIKAPALKVASPIQPAVSPGLAAAAPVAPVPASLRRLASLP